MAALHEAIAHHAEVEKHLVELIQLVQVSVNIWSIINLCLTDFSEDHGGFVLQEVQSLDLLEAREECFVH